MAGLYLHIPFCESRCSYCDFYTVTNTSLAQNFVDALCLEISQRKLYLHNETIHTIYFGGGTPSVLSELQMKQIFNQIYSCFNVAPDAECTFEANPDDLTPEYLSMLAQTPINRLSMGVQSFNDNDLKFMNRRHSAKQAALAVMNDVREGFYNITIDLIYGLPAQTPQKWLQNVEKALSLPVQHLSCYHLMYEQGTLIYRLKEKKKITPVIENISNKMFDILIDETKKAGFEHYEISNFALKGFYSRHNSAYWKGEKYLGLGPSAHSFDGASRQWNKKGVFAYVKAMQENSIFFEKEWLSAVDRFNEYVMTGMRTNWGCNKKEMGERFDEQLLKLFRKNMIRWVESGHVVFSDNAWCFSQKGIMISDAILTDLIVDDEDLSVHRNK